MAHALWNYKGACKSIHGHSYKLFVTLIGSPLNDPHSPANGMIADFTEIKKWIRTPVVDYYDHALLISRNAQIEGLDQVSQMTDKLRIVNYQPTCENILIDIVKKIKEALPENVSLHSVKLCETATSYAEWFASDNS